jgi:hypothetical protein
MIAMTGIHCVLIVERWLVNGGVLRSVRSPEAYGYAMSGAPKRPNKFLDVPASIKANVWKLNCCFV